MNRLPDELVCHISGYYGQKIPVGLSAEINNQRLLYSIKENEYYDEYTRTWHIIKVVNILAKYASFTNKTESLYKNYVWKDADKLVNLLWWSCSHGTQKEIMERHFRG